MRAGVFLPTFAASGPIDVPALRRMAIDAERRGFEYIFLGDHFVWNVGILAPIPTLAHLAAVTTRIKLGTGVYLLALRQPMIAAKDLSAIAALSGERFILGVGSGGENPLEYEAVGVSARNRGVRTEETLTAVQSLLDGKAEPIEGKYTSLPAVTLAPRPTRKIPVWFGGRADVVVDRAIRVGDGWFPVWVSASRYARERDRITSRRDGGFAFALNLFVAIEDSRESGYKTVSTHMQSAYQLPFEKFEKYVAYGTSEQILEMVERYREAGVSEIIFNLTGPDPEGQLARLAEEVLPQL